MNQIKPKSSIENLSNEIFYEMFDYLDGCELYGAFLNLNSRFQELLHSSSLFFKIKSCFKIQEKMFTKHWQQIISNHRQQILAINFAKKSFIPQFFFSFSIDSSLNRLESLSLNHLEFDELVSVLIHLTYLPRLYSLTINSFHESINLTVIYQIILKLTKLKYYKFSAHRSDLHLLPFSSNHQFSPIEYLTINHPYTFKQLAVILSYIPQLRRLNLTSGNDNYPHISSVPSMNFSHLTHLSIQFSYLEFDRFETFIKMTSFQLKYLSVNIWQNIIYLDAQRWEQLILHYLTQLKTLDLKYYDNSCEGYTYPVYSKEIDQFTTAFWIERQWILHAKTTIGRIEYSIGPYRKQWYDYTEDSIELLKASRFIIDYQMNDYKLLVKDIERVLTIQNIYHLEISKKNLAVDLLIRIIDFFPQLLTLKIHSLSLNQAKDFYSENYSTKITKVYVEKVFNMDDIYFLMTFCPYMTYLKIGFLNDIDIEDVLKTILQKITHHSNQYLRFLGFYLSNQDDNIIEYLEKIIDSEQLIVSYTIKRIVDEIYLEWK